MLGGALGVRVPERGLESFGEILDSGVQRVCPSDLLKCLSCEVGDCVRDLVDLNGELVGITPQVIF